ncbi:hypothetical protein JZM24_06350 [Candidatus Sodalis endolongispinus]|uniref:Uncharacterized protein n=1 Tax=Candidatus Sodalis endolongispinus TaxID=2812662 RepID=A0ABS5YAW6_9GAMM|nr:hypothetical protein [Candidatus Sodalis endolongispinus]MBT9431852.1 hypothetical protein [Candidatus Sodalis endolongispinus]
MNTVSLQGLNSSNILHHTNEGQRRNTGAQSDQILQAWRDWANAAVRGKFDVDIVVGELRHEKALPTLEKRLNESNVKMNLSELWQ